MSVENLLQEWGLSELIAVFSDNDIDMEAIRLLSEDDIKQLLPKVGVRVKFMAKWQQHFKKPTTVQVFDVKLPAIEEFPTFEDAALVSPTPFGSPSNIDSVSTASADSDEDMPEPLAHRTEVEPCASSHLRAASPSSVPPLKRQNAILFDARRILSQTHEGRSVTKKIDETGFLMKKERHKLVSILVGHLITQIGPKPSSFEKSALAESIVRSFPCLRDPDGISGFEAFYMKGSSRRPATGYLEEHLRYIRKKMIEKKTGDDGENSETSSGSKPEVLMTPELQEKIDWMKTNSEPTSQVHRYMAETFHYRREMMTKRECTISEILLEFPRLMDAEMLDQDFQFMFPVVSRKFMENWGNFSTPIIQYGTQMNPSWQDTLGVGPLDLDTLPTDEKNHLALLMLPLIFESRSKGKGKARGGRCAMIDSLSAFIDLKLNITHLPSYLQNIDSAKTPQPYILSLYADNRLQPTQSMVIIERRAIPTSSMMTAVDICYKAHFVLDIQFQKLCHGVWDFIQTIVYEQAGLKCSTTPSVRAFRAYLKNAVAAN